MGAICIKCKHYCKYDGLGVIAQICLNPQFRKAESPVDGKAKVTLCEDQNKDGKCSGFNELTNAFSKLLRAINE